MPRSEARRLGLALVSVAAAAIALTACSSDSGGATPSESGTAEVAPFTWAFGTGAAGGTSYNIGAAQAEAIREAGGPVTLIAEETAGGPANATRIANGQLQLAWLQSSEVYAALNGEGNFEETGPLEGFELVLSGTQGGVGFIASAGSGIETYEDLCGHTVGTTSPGAKTNLASLLSSAGLDPECVSWQIGASYDQMVTAITDGTLDAGGFIGIPTAAGTATLQLAESADVVFVSADPKDKKAHDAEYPYWPLSTVPAGTFPNQDEDWLIAGFFQSLYTKDTVPEDQVYATIQALLETNEACTALQPGCAAFSLEATAERLTSGVSIAPPSPALVKVLEETGTEYTWNG